MATNILSHFENEMQGRSENNRVVNIAGDRSMVGQFLEVEITSALTNSLRGKVV